MNSGFCLKSKRRWTRIQVSLVTSTVPAFCNTMDKGWKNVPSMLATMVRDEGNPLNEPQENLRYFKMVHKLLSAYHMAFTRGADIVAENNVHSMFGTLGKHLLNLSEIELVDTLNSLMYRYQNITEGVIITQEEQKESAMEFQRLHNFFESRVNEEQQLLTNMFLDDIGPLMDAYSVVVDENMWLAGLFGDAGAPPETNVAAPAETNVADPTKTNVVVDVLVDDVGVESPERKR